MKTADGKICEFVNDYSDGQEPSLTTWRERDESEGKLHYFIGSEEADREKFMDVLAERMGPAEISLL